VRLNQLDQRLDFEERSLTVDDEMLEQEGTALAAAITVASTAEEKKRKNLDSQASNHLSSWRWVSV